MDLIDKVPRAKHSRNYPTEGPLPVKDSTFLFSPRSPMKSTEKLSELTSQDGYLLKSNFQHFSVDYRKYKSMQKIKLLDS